MKRLFQQNNKLWIKFRQYKSSPLSQWGAEFFALFHLNWWSWWPRWVYSFWFAVNFEGLVSSDSYIIFLATLEAWNCLWNCIAVSNFYSLSIWEICSEWILNLIAGYAWFSSPLSDESFCLFTFEWLEGSSCRLGDTCNCCPITIVLLAVFLWITSYLKAVSSTCLEVFNSVAELVIIDSNCLLVLAS